MAPSTITLVRHAQGYHNISVANHSIHDPMLTPTGEEQCRILAQNFPQAHMDQIELIIASPLKRTIYTALLSFAPVIKQKNLKVLLLPELQETSDLPCDTGSSLEEIEKEFAGKPIDTSLMRHAENVEWNNKKGRWAPNSSAIEARAKDAREFLYARNEKEVAVVTHGGFLHYFTQDWSDTNRLDGTPSAGTRAIHPSLAMMQRSSPSPFPQPSSLSFPSTNRVSIEHHPSSSDNCARGSAPRIYQTSPHDDHFSHLRKHIDHAKREIRTHKRVAGTGWANTEYRHYIMTTPNGEVAFVETPESRKKRLPDQKPLSKEEQKNLQRAVQAQWAEQEKQEREYQRVKAIQAKV